MTCLNVDVKDGALQGVVHAAVEKKTVESDERSRENSEIALAVIASSVHEKEWMLAD